jgi:hypothetical protein
VYKVKSDYQAGQNDGKWFFTASEYQAKKKVFFVDSEYRADLKIYFVDAEYRAGWKNSGKKHLLY